MDGRQWPFGRYLMMQMRDRVGWPKPIPRAKLREIELANAEDMKEGYVPELGVSLRRESRRRVDAVVADNRNRQNKARKVI